MAIQDVPSSSLPPSMGPGARPIQPNPPVQSSHPSQSREQSESTLQEVMKIRSSYHVDVQDQDLSLAYELDGSIRSHRLNFGNLPLGGFSQWILYGGPQRAQVAGIHAIDTLRGIENVTGRRLTQNEAEAVTYHSSKRQLYNISGNIIGCLAGGTIAWRTREKMKFPFRSPQPLEGYNHFPSRNFSIVNGSYARALWQVTRANVWAVLCLFVSAPLFASMGDVSMMAGIYRDRRTVDLIGNLKGSLDRIASNRKSAANKSRNPGSQTLPNQESSDQNQERNQDTYSQHDYSEDSTQEPPSDSQSINDYYRTSNAESNWSSEGQDSENQWNRNNSGTNSAYRTSDTTSSSTSKDIFFDDDASPTAGNEPYMSTSSDRGLQQGGSAWDRVRNQRRGPANTDQAADPATSRGWNRSPSREDRYGSAMSSANENFSFSKSDADKSYAREQAQKEFDDMLERERRTSGSDDYDRGMKAIEASQERQTEQGMSAWEQRRRGK